MRIIATLTPLVTFPVWVLAQSPSGPTINVENSVDSNRKAGSKILVGQILKTGPSGVLVANFSWGGVKGISMLPRSSLLFTSYGFKANGGRKTEFDVAGEIYFSVFTKNKNSEVKVCFKNVMGRRACSPLGKVATSLKITPVDEIGGFAFGVAEGCATLEDEEGLQPPIEVKAGHYSLFSTKGYSAPIKADGLGYALAMPRTKTIGTFRVWPGWTFVDGQKVIQGPIGVPLKAFPPTH